MTATATNPPTPEPKAARQRRSDCYTATIKVRIPLDMANADSLSDAIRAAQGIEATLPAGSICEITGTLGKM